MKRKEKQNVEKHKAKKMPTIHAQKHAKYVKLLNNCCFGLSNSCFTCILYIIAGLHNIKGTV